jgi:TatD DNase family protein
MTPTTQPSHLSFIDIGANLLDDRFIHGVYHESHRHEPDLEHLWQRASRAGLKRIILTAGTLAESKEALKTAREWNKRQADLGYNLKFHCTVGVHPTRTQQEFCSNGATEAGEGEDASEHQGESAQDASSLPPAHAVDDNSPPVYDTEHVDRVFDELVEVARDGMTDGTVVAVGELGLDYARLMFSPRNVQLEFFKQQLLRLARPTGLPLFLHNRETNDDMYKILSEHKDCWQSAGGVVHSFDDSLELAKLFIEDMGLYIGLNGCSLRTDESLRVVEELPLDKILLETDSPYCEIRNTHPSAKYVKTKFEAKAEKKFQAGYCVKSRQEPCHIVQVAEVVAGVKRVPLEEVAQVCYANTEKLFGWSGGSEAGDA